MNSNQKIAVIGGTGKAGKYLVKALLKQGFQVKLLLRDPAKFQTIHTNVEILHGNVENYTDVYALLHGCDAVVSMLGLGIPPSKHTIFSQATTHILRSMKALNLKRYIIITGLNVDTPFDHKSEKTAAGTAWMKTNFPVSTADKQLEYELLSASDLHWTLVRLPMIEQTDEKPEITVDLTDCPGDGISATSLAYFVIDQLDQDQYEQQAPFIADVKLTS